MPHHGNDEEHQNDQDQPTGVLQQGDGRAADNDTLSRPEQILREEADEEGATDEEAVLAYNANAESEAERTEPASEQ
jgi:hypothetical protein